MAEAVSAARTVRLRRRGQPPSFGFWLRGGREHGTGFFVSAVEPRSDAQRRGLRVGDQIVRINGFPVDDAVHQEVLHFIQLQNQLSLKVRTMGMLPVKEKKTDPVTWCVVEKNNNKNISSSIDEMRIFPAANSFTSDDCVREVKISITATPKSKLGCGICKGPDWHTGVFVQFTKENGLAREAGLRPGDQIIECNGVKFDDISFSEAVSILKGSRNLELLVRKGAGLDLFPGESSGYNSSASSVAGDQSPNWEETKRLSIVKEESTEFDERFCHLQNSQSAGLKANKDWKQIEYEWEQAEKEEEEMKKHSQRILNRVNECSITGSRTVIHLGENGITTCIEKIAQNGTELTSKRCAGRELHQQQHQDVTTVIVEVHQSETPDEDTEQVPICPPPPAPPVAPLLLSDTIRCQPLLKKSTSSSSCASLSSNMSATSLSSAISEELQRRLQQRKVEDFCSQELKRNNKPSISIEKRQQHEQLMEEFKLVHQKMFAGSTQGVNDTDSSDSKKETYSKGYTVEERYAQKSQKPENKDEHHSQKTDHPFLKKKNLISEKEQVDHSLRHKVQTDGNNSKSQISKGSNGYEQDSSTSSSFSVKSSPTSTPPSCPTPDYDNMSTTSSVSPRKLTNSAHGQVLVKELSKKLSTSVSSSASHKTVEIINRTDTKRTNSEMRVSNKLPDKSAESVEMESLESFKLTNPRGPPPKPPQTYFNTTKERPSTMDSSSSSSSDGSTSSKSQASIKKHRPVSVIIGEYPSGKEKRQPSKFDFLDNAVSNGTQNCPVENKMPVSSLLHSELSQTLSRSNLRRRTEENGIIVNGGSTVEKQEGSKVKISVNSDTLCNNFSSSPSFNKGSDANTRQIANSVSKASTLSKVPLFNGTLKSNVKPSIQRVAEKLGSKLENNSVTVVIANEKGNKDICAVKSDTNQS
ncbi:serine-rich adhesin for platelets-like isoform X1 [Schistocerca nitens]|uniref:serine-rich adhesin for platelets-like isoform X1 n=2 Tax=Schistocerca nitens TaxID=7011 RepID=UPI0021182DBB|nr:serine-rich adhesin for platelets-like isoform X1 [Schistocerca nitens]